MYVKDSRALMGALAMLLSGGILTSMIQLYFDGQSEGAGVVMSRWWWEIVMNLQVMSIALLWFCFVDRISEAEGSRKRVLQFRLVCNMLIALLPVWMALVSGYANWFVERPPIAVIDYLVAVMIGFWAFVVLMSRLMVLRGNAKAYGGAGFWSVIRFPMTIDWLPTYIVAALFIYGQAFGGTLHYRLIPMFLYLQAAMPYLKSGLTKQPPSNP
jgi:hypothetical protein